MSIVPTMVMIQFELDWWGMQKTVTREQYIANRAAEWALEMAAKACEDQNTWYMDDPGETAARVIRALLKGGESDEN
jgi:hypothetical protein